MFADIDPQHAESRPGRGRSRDHAAHEGARHRRHLRLPGRVRRADPALREARHRADRRLVRGARRDVQGQAARLARASRGLGVLPEQADDHGRGRRGDDRRRRAARAARVPAQPGPPRDVELVAARSSRLTTTASTISRLRSGSGSSRSSAASSTRDAPWRCDYNELLSDVDVETPLADDEDHVRSWFVYVVKLPSGVDRDAVMAQLSAQGIATAPYLPSIHLQSYMRELYGFSEGMLPVSEDCSERTMALPFHAPPRPRGPGARRRRASRRDRLTVAKGDQLL